MKKPKFKISKSLITTLLLVTALTAIPAFADSGDPFASVFTKISTWTTGTAGKLITLVAFIMSAISGVAGFRPAVVFGCLGVGIVLAGSASIVNILFS